MTEFRFRLVRDDEPSILARSGDEAAFLQIPETDMPKALVGVIVRRLDSLYQAELLEEPVNLEFLENCADIIDALSELATRRGIDFTKVLEAASFRRSSYGGFDKRLVRKVKILNE